MKTNWMSPQMVRVTTLLAVCLAAVAVSGCSKKFDLKKNIPWGERSVDDKGAPGRMTTFWTDTVLHKDGQAVRGFGGRIMFQEHHDTDPIEVDGTLEVYAFEETNREAVNVKPDRKYVFPAEQLQQHYSKSKAGHSYSFWLPWGPAGGERTEISLIARFTPKSGGIIVSEQTRHLLPGSAPLIESIHVSKREIHSGRISELQQLAGMKAAGTAQTMKTESIQLPPQLGRQITQGTNSQPTTTLTLPTNPTPAIAQHAVGLPPIPAVPANVQPAVATPALDQQGSEVQQTQFVQPQFQPQVPPTQFQAPQFLGTQFQPQLQPVAATPADQALMQQQLPAANSMVSSSVPLPAQPTIAPLTTPGRDAVQAASRNRVPGGSINQIDQNRAQPWSQYGLSTRFHGSVQSGVTPSVPTVGAPNPAVYR